MNRAAKMDFDAEEQAVKQTKAVLEQKTTDLAEAIVNAALAQEALEDLRNTSEETRPQSRLSNETRRITAEKAITATVQRLLQKRSRHIP